MQISLVQPCPPHEWSHAPTVGYFLCSKCSERVNYDDPRYDEIMRETQQPTEHEGLVWRVARAISVPQHHTTWDTIPENEKDLFYMQAEYAIAAVNPAIQTLVEALEYISTETGNRGDGLIDWQRCVDRIQKRARDTLSTLKQPGGR